MERTEKERVGLEGKVILVTGGMGFIGSVLIKEILKRYESITIVSLDSRTEYYEVELKDWRLEQIKKEATLHMKSKFTSVVGDIEDKTLVNSLFETYKFDVVVNLAAQAGTRYSIDNPDSYIKTNIVGFYNILEVCRHNSVKHLVYASSSSVYGENEKVPFCVNDKTDFPVSLYAATKKSNEVLAYSYAHLYSIPITGLRFFTVYGPAGRPDMFYYKATKQFLKGEKIQIYNYGNCIRDFTYIDDIVEGLIRVMSGAPIKSIDSLGSIIPPYAMYNIGGGNPVSLLDFVGVLQEELVRAELVSEDFDFEKLKENTGRQLGDVSVTYADSSDLERDYGFVPKVKIQEGLRLFVEWYKDYYKE